MAQGIKCPYCGKDAVWFENAVIYGRRYGKSFMIWWCQPCDAYVGCHQNTRRPLGTLANARLRGKRREAHAAIDPLWQSGRYRRDTVYRRLAEAFGREIHVGSADEATCEEIVRAVPLIFNLPRSCAYAART